MHRTHSPYERRLVEFHRQHDIPPRSSSPASSYERFPVVAPTPASKPRRTHPLILLFFVVYGLLTAVIMLEQARLPERSYEAEPAVAAEPS